MWSGPRNISTTLLRAWGARPDTFVCDEPLYAHYLLRTGAPHPGRERVIASHETDWRRVVDWLTGPVPGGKTVFYQKHMAKHLLPEVGRDWLDSLSHAFLIREPAEMLASFARVVPDPSLEDTGLPLQCELFEQVADRTGRAPPVIDSRDVLDDPAGVLARLCEALGVPYTDDQIVDVTDAPDRLTLRARRTPDPFFDDLPPGRGGGEEVAGFVELAGNVASEASPTKNTLKSFRRFM